MWRTGFLLLFVVLSGCAGGGGPAPAQGFHVCDRNGDQEERKACLP